jgi:hypothetical protein
VVGNPIDRHLSSQILDSLLSVFSIVRSTNFQDQHTILVRVAANSIEAEIRNWPCFLRRFPVGEQQIGPSSLTAVAALPSALRSGYLQAAAWLVE